MEYRWVGAKDPEDLTGMAVFFLRGIPDTYLTLLEFSHAQTINKMVSHAYELGRKDAAAEIENEVRKAVQKI